MRIVSVSLLIAALIATTLCVPVAPGMLGRRAPGLGSSKLLNPERSTGEPNPPWRLEGGNVEDTVKDIKGEWGSFQELEPKRLLVVGRKGTTSQVELIGAQDVSDQAKRKRADAAKALVAKVGFFIPQGDLKLVATDAVEGDKAAIDALDAAAVMDKGLREAGEKDPQSPSTVVQRLRAAYNYSRHPFEKFK
ncbi:hypothetical protein FRB94_003821 [Tulasnella sp. JGI-2019a]|nr:hypothetical protein FRB93_002764 [Tulasnella sp. JGI-2019a]KAG9002506.1 hypothetical protein FRB94_003821 [Tulasnella sp. JGI-2019a]